MLPCRPSTRHHPQRAFRRGPLGRRAEVHLPEGQLTRDWSRGVGDGLAPHMRHDLPATRTPHRDLAALGLMGMDTPTLSRNAHGNLGCGGTLEASRRRNPVEMASLRMPADGRRPAFTDTCMNGPKLNVTHASYFWTSRMRGSMRLDFVI
jgi:hypothetical protein